MAAILEEHHVPYRTAIDLDWLMWFWTGHDDVHEAREVFLVNLRSVVHNYREHGVRYFLLALFVSGADEASELRRVLDMATTVIRLERPHTTSLRGSSRR